MQKYILFLQTIRDPTGKKTRYSGLKYRVKKETPEYYYINDDSTECDRLSKDLEGTLYEVGVIKFPYNR